MIRLFALLLLLSACSTTTADRTPESYVPASYSLDGVEPDRDTCAIVVSIVYDRTHECDVSGLNVAGLPWASVEEAVETCVGADLSFGDWEARRACLETMAAGSCAELEGRGECALAVEW